MSELNQEIKYGYCHCGCDGKTRIPKHDHKTHGYKKGVPIKFIPGHHASGKNNPRWKGGVRKRPDGYMVYWTPGHPRANKNFVLEHILIVEKAMRKHLSIGHEVHHVNSIRCDNENKNLVACEDVSYHRTLHKRIRALRECGHASWKKCVFCNGWDDPKNMTTNCQGSAYHLYCLRSDNKKRIIVKNIGKPSKETNTRNSKNRRDNKSGIKGVCWVKRDGNWKAEITINGEYSFLGQYNHFDNAVCARLAAEQCLWNDKKEYLSPAFKYVKKNIKDKEFL